MREGRRIVPLRDEYILMSDIYDVGPTKPLGYVPVDVLVKHLSSATETHVRGRKNYPRDTPEIQKIIREMEMKGLKTLFASNSQNKNFPADLYVYDEYALQTLLHAHASVLRRAGWPLVPHLFVREVARRHGTEESGMYALVAKAFGREVDGKLKRPYNYQRPWGGDHNPRLSREFYKKDYEDRYAESGKRRSWESAQEYWGGQKDSAGEGVGYGLGRALTVFTVLGIQPDAWGRESRERVDKEPFPWIRLNLSEEQRSLLRANCKDRYTDGRIEYTLDNILAGNIYPTYVDGGAVIFDQMSRGERNNLCDDVYDLLDALTQGLFEYWRKR